MTDTIRAEVATAVGGGGGVLASFTINWQHVYEQFGETVLLGFAGGIAGALGGLLVGLVGIAIKNWFKKKLAAWTE